MKKNYFFLHNFEDKFCDMQFPKVLSIPFLSIEKIIPTHPQKNSFKNQIAPIKSTMLLGSLTRETPPPTPKIKGKQKTKKIPPQKKKEKKIHPLS